MSFNFRSSSLFSFLLLLLVHSNNFNQHVHAASDSEQAISRSEKLELK